MSPGDVGHVWMAAGCRVARDCEDLAMWEPERLHRATLSKEPALEEEETAHCFIGSARKLLVS